MEGTKLIKCTCLHKDQDDMYGEQIRVHNINPKGDAKCTVCGSVRSPKAAPVTLSGNKTTVKAAKS